MHKSQSENNLSVPENQVSLFRHVIKQLGFGKSLANVTLPSWFLERRSILERFTDWMLHADILRHLNDEELPELRMLHLCSWIISGFHMTPKVPKKPYSSLRGECFRASLYDDSNESQNDDNNENDNDNDNDNDNSLSDTIIGSYIAEQVTQHPCVCAFHYKDRVGNIIVWGNSEMRSKISFNSVAAIMDNPNTKVNVEHLLRGESYVFNFPDMYGRGVFSGPKILEIVGKVRIECKKTGYFAKITFLPKGINSSKTYNSLKGKIYKVNVNEKGKKVKDIIIQFKGHWDDKVYYWYTDSRNESNNQNLGLKDDDSTENCIQMNQLRKNNFVNQSQYPGENANDISATNQEKKSTPLKLTSSSPMLFSLDSKSKKSKKSSKEIHPSNEHLMFDAKNARNLNIVIPPIEDQSQYESRFVWRRVTECLENGDPETANLYQKALTENLKKAEKCFELSKKNWTYQLFDYNEKQKRFIPKDLDLSLYHEGEPQLQLHPGFNVPPQIVELQEEGKIKTTLQIQEEVDASLQNGNDL